MDNAIEACTRNNGKGKDITVIIKQFKSDLFIEINNAYLVNEIYKKGKTECWYRYKKYKIFSREKWWNLSFLD